MSVLRFVPTSAPVAADLVARANEVLARSERVLVLTGAGVSTESGKRLLPPPAIPQAFPTTARPAWGSTRAPSTARSSTRTS